MAGDWGGAARTVEPSRVGTSLFVALEGRLVGLHIKNLTSFVVSVTQEPLHVSLASFRFKSLAECTQSSDAHLATLVEAFIRAFESASVGSGCVRLVPRHGDVSAGEGAGTAASDGAPLPLIVEAGSTAGGTHRALERQAAIAALGLRDASPGRQADAATGLRVGPGGATASAAHDASAPGVSVRFTAFGAERVVTLQLHPVAALGRDAFVWSLLQDLYCGLLRARAAPVRERSAARSAAAVSLSTPRRPATASVSASPAAVSAAKMATGASDAAVEPPTPANDAPDGVVGGDDNGNAGGNDVAKGGEGADDAADPPAEDGACRAVESSARAQRGCERGGSGSAAPRRREPHTGAAAAATTASPVPAAPAAVAAVAATTATAPRRPQLPLGVSVLSYDAVLVRGAQRAALPPDAGASRGARRAVDASFAAAAAAAWRPVNSARPGLRRLRFDAAAAPEPSPQPPRSGRSCGATGSAATAGAAVSAVGAATTDAVGATPPAWAAGLLAPRAVLQQQLLEAQAELHALRAAMASAKGAAPVDVGGVDAAAKAGEALTDGDGAKLASTARAKRGYGADARPLPRINFSGLSLLT